MHFLLQFPSLLHSLIQCIFFSVFHPSFTFPKHCWYHLDRIVWGFLSLTTPFFSFCLLDCVFLSASRVQCLVWWKGISQPVVATLSALLPSLSLLLPLVFPLSSYPSLLIFIAFFYGNMCFFFYKISSGQWDASFLNMHWSVVECICF